MAKKKKPFKFPKSILNQIEECSSGGFMLFTFEEEGRPEVHSSFDNIQNAMAMQYYIENWSKAVSDVNLSNTIEAISRDVNEIEEPPEDSFS